MARTTFSGPVASQNGFITGTPSAPYVTTSSTATGTATRAASFIVNPTASFGSSTATAPSSAQGVAGQVFGSGNQTSTATYYIGTMGRYLMTGTNASTFAKAGVMGVVGDQTTTADAAVMAWMDGDGGVTTARAGFGIGMTQSTGASGFDYGMDLNLQDAVGGGGSIRPYKKAEIRVSNNVVVMTGAGAPTSGASGTGDDFAGPGSLFVDVTGANLYVQAGTISSPDWKLVTRAA
jgi:hypothetical protein